MTAVAVGAFDDLEALPNHPAAYFGAGARHLLPEVLAGAPVGPKVSVAGRPGVRRVLLVRGRQSFTRSGIAGVLGRLGCVAVEHLIVTAPNPTVAAVRAGVAVARQSAPDVVVGVGGGSVLDLAKMVAVLASQPGEAADYLVRAKPVAGRRPALVLLPTTCGSGSELTGFATVYLGERKLSLDSGELRADVVLVDPDLSASVPRPTAAGPAADALCQAVESFWAVSATAASRALAWRSFQTALPAVHRGFPDLTDPAGAASGPPTADPARAGGLTADLAKAAALSGAAINLTRTTAAHALSYGLTARLGLPHGLAVALHMRWLLGHNAGVSAGDCRHPAGALAVAGYVADLERACTAVTGGSLSELLERLLRAGRRPAHLAELALDPATWLATWTEAVGSARARNNPRTVTLADVRDAAAGGRRR